MECKLFLIVLLGVLVFSSVIESKRRTRAQRRSRIERKKWIRDVNPNVSVKEVAAVLRNRERIFFKSADRKLRNAGITRSVSYIDNTSEFMVVKAFVGGSRKCLILPGNITQDFNTTVEDILTRNRVNETAQVGDFVMSSDAVLSQIEKDDFKVDNRYLSRVCRRNEMLNVTLPFTETSDILDKYPVTVLTIGGRITVYISAALGI